MVYTEYLIAQRTPTLGITWYPFGDTIAHMIVNLTKRIVTPQGKRYCAVVVSANGRIKPHWVVVNGSQEHHPEGAYYLDWNLEGRRTRESVGKDAALAFSRKLKKEAELKATGLGIALAETPGNRLDIQAAIASYLYEIKLTKKKATWWSYAVSLRYFQESCAKRYVDELERIDLLKYAAYLRDEKDQSPRSCRNKFGDVMVFLKTIGKNTIIRKNDWPRFTAEEVETYSKEELTQFFSACSPEERLIYQLFLKSGKREQEVMHTTWRDFDAKQGTLAVRHKPQYNWSPKAYKERIIPIPDTLVAALESVRPKNAGDSLMFPTSTGRPQQQFLRCLKRVVERAGLDSTQWYLHKFRSTFATMHLQAGVDLRTVQSWLGHADLASTLRYLRPSEGKAVRDRVNATFD